MGIQPDKVILEVLVTSQPQNIAAFYTSVRVIDSYYSRQTDDQDIDSEDKLHYESGFDYSINEEKSQ